MKKNIFLLSIMFFSVAAMAVGHDIDCGKHNPVYRIMGYNDPNVGADSVGLVDEKNNVWTKLYGGDVEFCSVHNLGFAMGGKTPITNIEHLNAYDAGNISNAVLFGSFNCFCGLNRNLLNNCTIRIAFATTTSIEVRTGQIVSPEQEMINQFRCVNGSVIQEY